MPAKRMCANCVSYRHYDALTRRSDIGACELYHVRVNENEECSDFEALDDYVEEE